MNKRQLKKKRKVILQFYRPEEKLPEKTCTVLAEYCKGCFTTMNFSSVHQAFNVQDWEDNPKTTMYPILWTYAPTI